MRAGVKEQMAGNRSEIRWHTDAIALLYALMMMGILGVCLFLPGIDYAKKWEALPNWLLLPCAAGVMLMGIPALARVKLRRSTVIIACLLAGAAQVFLVSQYYFYTDWDVETIVDCALAIADGHDISRHNNYFSMYQNNLVLVTLFGMAAKLAGWLGMEEYAYFAILVFQCVINWGTGILLYMLVRRVSGSNAAAAVSCILYGVLVGLSPWVSIPYSDSVALFFPTAILYVYIQMKNSGKTDGVRLFLIAFLSYFGYRIKPQTVIVLIAVSIVEGIEWLVSSRVWQIRKIGAALSGCLCAMLLCNTMAAQVDVEIDRNKSFGLSHFLMMGLNTEEFGAYYQRDVSSSWWMETQQERTEMNLQVAAERIREMGPVGFAQLMIRKTLTNYNDGTFCWGGEGVFYREILPEKNSVLSPLMRNIYYGPKEIYQGEYGQYYVMWQSIVQAAWMLTILLSVAGVTYRRNKAVSVAMLALIGLTLFELLFEARARYLYSYVPVYILMAGMGFDRIRIWAAGKKK